jgi:hypothetical protein
VHRKHHPARPLSWLKPIPQTHRETLSPFTSIL